jgi:cyclopropane-fatty-acyl-phospholipid synthase
VVRSKIYGGRIFHSRLADQRSEVTNDFSYPVYFYAFDSREISDLHRDISFFSFNRRNLVALFEKDHLMEESGSLLEKCQKLLERKGISQKINHFVLVTSPRLLNYVFNPVSFFYCYSEENELLAVISEVNNTFDERHVYVLPRAELTPLQSGSWMATKIAKEFHVSPFYDRSGHYTFTFCPPLQEQLTIRINLHREDKTIFASSVTGEARALTGSNVLAMILKYPLNVFLTMPRILWQAARLHYKKGLPVHSKPHPQSNWTIKYAAPSLFQKMARQFVLNHLGSLQRGGLNLIEPDGNKIKFGRDNSDTSPALHVRSHRFYTRCLISADIGFGEAYMDADWESSNPVGVLEFFARNLPVLNRRVPLISKPGKWLHRRWHVRHGNSIRQSQKNIQAHYDLSNEFFQTFLDPSMTYSCAYFKNLDDDLAQAQLNKIDRILDLLDLQPHHHLLEIGSGWGALAIRAVQRFGCTIHSITLSQKQLDEAKARAIKSGVSDKIKFELLDYRKVTGTYDRVVSVEMLEAVGHEHLKSFFSTVNRSLKPQGKAALQVITIPENRYDFYKASVDWIQKYVFPGGHCPSLLAMMQAMNTRTQLVVDHVENMGSHYARTLEVWRRNCHQKKEQIHGLGFDEKFFRLWDYYLAYCEAAFRAQSVQVLQIGLHKL